jgi:predicted RNA-binding Zn-ribbon protein involved in translation (DUF1610 family)
METAQDIAREICDRFGRLDVECDECGFVGVTDNFNIEVGFFHSAELSFECPECGQHHIRYV